MIFVVLFFCNSFHNFLWCARCASEYVGMTSYTPGSRVDISIRVKPSVLVIASYVLLTLLYWWSPHTSSSPFCQTRSKLDNGEAGVDFDNFILSNSSLNCLKPWILESVHIFHSNTLLNNQYLPTATGTHGRAGLSMTVSLKLASILHDNARARNCCLISTAVVLIRICCLLQPTRVYVVHALPQCQPPQNQEQRYTYHQLRIAFVIFHLLELRWADGFGCSLLNTDQRRRHTVLMTEHGSPCVEQADAGGTLC